MPAEFSSRASGIIYDLSRDWLYRPFLEDARRFEPRLLEHCRRVARLCIRVGEELGMPPQRLRTIGSAGLLHGVGRPPGRSGDAELELLKFHPIVGFMVLKDAIGDTGNFSSEYEQIVAAADMFDGALAQAVNKRGMPAWEALKIVYGEYTGDRKYLKALKIVVLGK